MGLQYALSVLRYIRGVREHCLELGLEGQRILTNFYHIAEDGIKIHKRPNTLLMRSLYGVSVHRRTGRRNTNKELRVRTMLSR